MLTPPAHPRTSASIDRSGVLPLTGAQRKKIWAVSHELGWSHDQVHEFIEVEVRKRSVRALTREEARLVIDRMERMVGRVPSAGYRDRGMSVNQTGALLQLATPAEIAKVRALGERMDVGERYLCSWASRVFDRRIGRLRDLHSYEVHKFINVVEPIVLTYEARQRQLALPLAENAQ